MPQPSFSLPSQVGSASPSFSLPSASSAAPTVDKPAQSEPVAEAVTPSTPAADAETSLERVGEATGESNLGSIDKLLAAIEEAPPPAPTPKVEIASAGDSAAAKAAAMGFDGKQVIHPSQIEPTRNAFIPSDQELAYAERAIAALEEAERNGQGAVTVDGKMVDYANIRMIRRLMSFRGQ